MREIKQHYSFKQINGLRLQRFTVRDDRLRIRERIALYEKYKTFFRFQIQLEADDGSSMYSESTKRHPTL